MLKLRDYQADAVRAAWDYIRDNDSLNPCLELPTGAGKTPVMSRLAADAVGWGGRVLILAHVKELIDQTASTILQWYPGIDVGIYSAGLGSRDKESQVLVAGIQSVYNRAFELSESRPFDLVMIDEAHRIPTDGDGTYRSMIADLKVASPHLRVVGLTATPYRLKGGYVCGPDNILNEIAFRVSVKDLIEKGYLSRLTSKQTLSTVDTSEVRTSGGEFVGSALEEAFDVDEKIEAAVEELIEYATNRGKKRKSIIVFCCGVDHAKHVAEKIEEKTGEKVGLVTGETPTALRDTILEQFKTGSRRWLCNVNVLTEGFDARSVDCVALMRSTLSPGLYYQMVGRGLRLNPGKDDCLVLDFGDNVMRHGCVDDIRIKGGPRSNGGGEAPSKICPECDEVVAASALSCGCCGFEFEVDKTPKHNVRASGLAITTDQIKPVRYEVDSVAYTEHTKKDGTDEDPKTLRVTYYGGNLGLSIVAEEWVCVEHSGWPRERAEAWWETRTGIEFPSSAKEASDIGFDGCLAEPIAILVEHKPGERFSRVVGYEFREPGDDDLVGSEEFTEDDIPF